MKRIYLPLLILLLTGTATQVNAFVTYGNVNNYFLEFFTNTGYSSYDWRFEPQKTDKERAQLKGDVVKVVTDILDKTGRGFGENSSDTTYYNDKGLLLQIDAPKYDYDGSRSMSLSPSRWVFRYTAEGLLDLYENYEDTEVMGGHEWRAHVHFIRRNEKGQPIKEEYGAYAKEGNDWKLYSSGLSEPWSFSYGADGSLTGGQFGNFSLMYQNGQLVRMQENGFAKPVTYTYDANGRMTAMKYYSIDGMDEEFYLEDNVVMTYNEQGYLSKVTKEQWETTSKWVRKRISYKTVYTITYTYDEKGNWTKAVMYSKTGNAPRQMAVTINRVISYHE